MDSTLSKLGINCTISHNTGFRQTMLIKKQNVINWGIALSGKTTGYGNFDYHWVWTSKDNEYSVGFGKYGKEYYSNMIRNKDKEMGNNPNDMKPLVKKNGEIIDFDGSFDHVFNFFQQVQKNAGDLPLEVLGCLMIRNAYLLDHVLIGNKYMYSPDESIISFITEKYPEYDGISSEAYLHYIDAISQNEDTKYSTLGYEIKQGYGRTNNLLTYAHLIAVLLGRASLSKLCGAFSRPPIGVAPITSADMKSAFPLLGII